MEVNFNSLFPTAGLGAQNAAKMNEERDKFRNLLESIMGKDGKLNGDYKSSMAGAFNSPEDKNAAVKGFAANSGDATQTIDKTSKLYEKSLELESYFVKILLSSMRNTLSRTGITGEKESHATETYMDMYFDELSTTVTKNAGFGIADKIYLELADHA